MTTSKKELAALLIESEETGREVQYQNKGTGAWQPTAILEVDFCYRLKPIIKYYRVWQNPINNLAQVDVSDFPHPKWSDDGPLVLIHDFEKEQ